MQDAVRRIMNEPKVSTQSAIKHWLAINCIAVQLIYTNMQHLGVVLFMETTEYINHQELNNAIIINMCHHKTVASRGPAKLVIKEALLINLLDDYYNQIRQKLTRQNNCLQKRFFLLSNRNEFSKVYKSMQQVAASFDFVLPSPTLNRKVFITEAVKSLPSNTIKCFKIIWLIQKQHQKSIINFLQL